MTQPEPDPAASDEGTTAADEAPTLVAGRYELGELLGKGGQGSTFKAVDRETGRPVAVKVFSLSKADDWKAFELFERECQVLHEIDHPGVPRYLGEFQSEDEDAFYLVMELVPGQTLRQRLQRQGPLDEGALWWVLWRLVEILAHLHVRVPPIVHRDIKPANLIERPDGRLVLVDFGGVRAFRSKNEGSTVVGTFGYMAPEQLHGQSTPATDVYAVGATLAALATGLEPEQLERKGLKMRLSKHLNVSKDLLRILDKLVEPDPDERPASAMAVRDLLVQMQAEQRGRGPAPKGGGPAPTPDVSNDARQRPRMPGGADDARGPSPTPPAETADAPPEGLSPSLPPPARIALGGAVTVISMMLVIFLALLEHMVIPTLFGLAEIGGSKKRKRKMIEREERARRLLTSPRLNAERSLQLGMNTVRSAVTAQRKVGRATAERHRARHQAWYERHQRQREEQRRAREEQRQERDQVRERAQQPWAGGWRPPAHRRVERPVERSTGEAARHPSEEPETEEER